MDGKKILVVDDDRFFREFLTESLQDRYQVVVATSGEEAIGLLSRLRPDLILLDVELPERSGLEVCRELKGSEPTRDIPVILISSGTRKNEIMLGLQAGADDYLTKPLCLPEALARIDAHLYSKRYYADLECRDLLMLLELNDAVSTLRNPQRILRIVVEKVAEVVNASRCSIVSAGRQGELVVKASSELPDDTEIRLAMDRYPEIGTALTTRQAIIVNDIRRDPIMVPVRSHVAELGYHAIIVVPIIKKESAIGTLFLHSTSCHPEGISRRAYNLCHLVANIAANALENASLFESMKIAHESLAEMAIRDGLTRLFTHRHFYARLDEEFSRALRYNEPLALIFFDIDDFKRINDACGHTFGDEVLRKIGWEIRQVIRESDVPARYGGEEFAILLPKTETGGALEMARRLSSIIRGLEFPFLEGARVTISTGISTFSAGDLHSYEELVRLADEAMYQAKATGKDRIVVAAAPPLAEGAWQLRETSEPLLRSGKSLPEYN